MIDVRLGRRYPMGVRRGGALHATSLVGIVVQVDVASAPNSGRNLVPQCLVATGLRALRCTDALLPTDGNRAPIYAHCTKTSPAEERVLLNIEDLCRGRSFPQRTDASLRAIADQKRRAPVSALRAYAGPACHESAA